MHQFRTIIIHYTLATHRRTHAQITSESKSEIHKQKENKMHIHPSSPSSSISEEDAATKIQAGFRGYRVRKQLKQNCNGRSTTGGVDSQNRNHHHHHHHRVNDEMNGHPRFKSANKALDREKCATKIQAGIRGFLVRKKQRVAADAAVKIQAGFRGFRARKQLKNLKE